MNRVAILSAIFACLAPGCGGSYAASAPWLITPDGIGPLKIGMTLKDASKALHAPLRIDTSDSDNLACTELDVPNQNGVGMMFEDQRLTRIIVYAPSRSVTQKGIGIGSTEADVKAKYHPLDDAPRTYEDLPAKDLTWWATKNVRGIRFETDVHGRIDTILAGSSAILYAEGCS